MIILFSRIFLIKVYISFTRASVADGIVFHGANHADGDFPYNKPEGQKWVFITEEQPGYFHFKENFGNPLFLQE